MHGDSMHCIFGNIGCVTLDLYGTSSMYTVNHKKFYWVTFLWFSVYFAYTFKVNWKIILILDLQVKQ